MAISVLSYTVNQLHSMNGRPQVKIPATDLTRLRDLNICKPEYKQTKRGSRGGKKRKTKSCIDVLRSSVKLTRGSNLIKSNIVKNDGIYRLTATDNGAPEQEQEQEKVGIDKKHTRILNVNCQSICNKYAQFTNLLNSLKPDIIVGTESWLDSSVKNNEYFPSEFDVYRKDRNRHGGGVFIAIRKEFQSSEVRELDTNCELVWAKMKIQGMKTLYVCSYYRPDVSDAYSLEQFEESLRRTNELETGIFIIGGDFNFPGMDWTNETYTIKSDTQYVKLHRDFLELINDCALSQIIDKPTRLDKTLDLLLTNYPSLVSNQEVATGISDHDVVYIDIDLMPRRHEQKPRSIPLYKKANWAGLKAHINQTESVLDRDSVTSNTEELWQKFKLCLETGVKEFIPHKKCSKKNSQPWITSNIRKLIRRRDRQFKKFKKTNDPKYLEKYKELKQQAQKEIRIQYWKYVENMFEPEEDREDSYCCMKRFWTYIKHKQTDSKGVAPIMYDNKQLTSAYDRATALNEQFQSVFSKKQPMSLKELAENVTREGLTYVSDNQPVIDDIMISLEGIAKLLQNIDPRKACGPDNIHSMVLKMTAEAVAPCLQIIFKKSLDTGEVPIDWRRANVAPIFKKGERDVAANYRPVSLTCVASKIMEHIIVSHIMKYADKYGILYDLQHGFRANRSCETQLISFVDDVSKSMDDGQQTDALIMDFSKAFDKVDHDRLCYKLRRYGINGNINRWIGNFLKNRSQSVVVEGESSDPVPVESGVPQGSVLGPTLFLFYINDIAKNITSNVRLFADDTIVYRTIKSLDDAKMLQNDLDRLAEWAENNKMEFHPQKCSVLTITNKKYPIKQLYQLHDHVLEHVHSAKYLGITINSDLRWNKHIETITAKANRTIGFLRRNLKIKSRKIKEKAYKALVRPLVEYASTVWDPYTDAQTKRIEMVQRRGARFTTGDYQHTSSVSKMMDDLEWQPLKIRRRNSRLTMLYKIKHKMVAISNPDLQHPVRTSRSSHPNSFLQLSTSSNFRKYSFYPRTIADWNKLPKEATTSTSLKIFQRQLSLTTKYSTFDTQDTDVITF